MKITNKIKKSLCGWGKDYFLFSFFIFIIKNRFQFSEAIINEFRKMKNTISDSEKRRFSESEKKQNPKL